LREFELHNIAWPQFVNSDGKSAWCGRIFGQLAVGKIKIANPIRERFC
jgi:hypothetical protein